jgi:ATP-dependent Clp protease ATP-binding subunit ClpA
MSYETRLTAAAREVMDLALREALAQGHNYIAPEHIEAGLQRHKPSKARMDELEARIAALEAER